MDTVVAHVLSLHRESFEFLGDEFSPFDFDISGPYTLHDGFDWFSNDERKRCLELGKRAVERQVTDFLFDLESIQRIAPTVTSDERLIWGDNGESEDFVEWCAELLGMVILFQPENYKRCLVFCSTESGRKHFVKVMNDSNLSYGERSNLDYFLELDAEYKVAFPNGLPEVDEELERRRSNIAQVEYRLSGQLARDHYAPYISMLVSDAEVLEESPEPKMKSWLRRILKR